MVQNNNNTISNIAWVAIDNDGTVGEFPYPNFVLELSGSQNLFSAISEGDWVLMARTDEQFTRVGRVLQLRSDTQNTTIYFDCMLSKTDTVLIGSVDLSLPTSGSIGRLQWIDFVEGLSKLSESKIEDIPLINDQAYIRELLQLAVMDDLLGPANGPHEQIVDMGVRDRYLVGKLAPREVQDGGDDWRNSALDETDNEEPADLVVKAKNPDMDAPKPSGRGEQEPSDEIDVSANQSLIPSSFGMTFCVDGNQEALEIEARWGRYERDYDADIYKTKRNKETGEEEQGQKAKVWQRIPCGGKINLALKEGIIAHLALDPDNPEVRVQGTIRGKNANGDRLVTIFLVNAQNEPDENKDAAWVFQPELIVRALDSAADAAIFRRRAVLSSNADDPERDGLEMIYRRQVEFAAGHGIAVHAVNVAGETEYAVEVRTVVMPQNEVPVTETPGLRVEDRGAMREMVDKGYLDMQSLADMDQNRLVEVLSILSADYEAWIGEQEARIGSEVIGHDDPAKVGIERCRDIHARLVEGIQVLGNPSNTLALVAFRFANRAMASQRIHSLYALARRRGEDVQVSDFDVRKNRSWRPFQLAFILLAIPSLADPLHKDRTIPIEAYAELLWFPTGGGKTEAYLGVAAFSMAIRRMQGDLGGYDSSRGLAVIMRYTLRLLTLQQFQRGTTLICAMEMLRQDILKTGDDTLGDEPFTIGLWVGNKVTPGSTEDSNRAIKDIRNPDKFDAGGTSPAQLTSCPWCGSEIDPGKDIEVDKSRKQTAIYCGDKKGRCEFSKGKSSKRPHRGIPVLVVDEEIYHRPPSMMIATVDKFAMMAWRGDVRTLFGKVDVECPRHGLLWPDADCKGAHPASKGLTKTQVKKIKHIRPPDLIIQDEFHLISGPLGTMVGLYETAIDELATWHCDGKSIRPKIVASTATVRKAKEQIGNVFMRNVAVFPPSGLDVEDNFFSVQRSVETVPGRRYFGVCSPGSSRPAMLIRVYTAFLTAAQGLFERFGPAADPYLTAVGYFNSLRELGGMRRLAEDDVQTRAYRVQMSLVDRPGLAQRSVSNIRELTSRVSSRDIPEYLDQLEVKFKCKIDPTSGQYVTDWQEGDVRAIDVVLATNMLSVGVDVNRLGLMVVNGQPKGTAEYIQATSRVGRAFPGIVCTVLTWARPRDLSHYETFEHYHSTFYKHVEAQSVTPFSPRALDRGLTGTALSMLRLQNNSFNPNTGAGSMDKPDKVEALDVANIFATRALSITEQATVKKLTSDMLQERFDEWSSEVAKGGRVLAYEKKGANKDTTVGLLRRPGVQTWDKFTVPMSMREVEPGVRLVMNTRRYGDAGPAWTPPPTKGNAGDDE